MNRRTSIGLLFGKQQAQAKSNATTVTVSLDPYTGPWEFAHAAHLLRRTTFGPTKSQINQILSDGMEVSISNLFENQPMPDPPIYYNFEDDPNIPNGETWIDDIETPNVNGLAGARKRSIYAWSLMLMRRSGLNIREKLTLFWHNHFVAANINRGRNIYKYIDFLRTNASGNFRTLVEGITIDSAMLLYLNGTQNSDNGPNENYARELLELFTIGKGPTAGPGDYTNYTEDDVVAIARALTGWRHFDAANGNEPTTPSFNPNRHDETDKQLSFRFDDVIITNEGENEYKTVIDIILQKEETARHICRKLYRWFLHSDLTPEVENNIIEPMAQIVLADNYEIANALKALLSSEHFYDIEIRGCMIANSIDHWFRMINTFEIAQPQDILTEYAVAKHMHNNMVVAEMSLFKHPTVAGWKAYYQAPQFDKLWINAVSLPIRQLMTEKLVNGYNSNGFHLKIDVLSFTASLDNPLNPTDLIVEAANILFAHPLTDEQVLALKDIFIPGLPDYEWTDIYSAYVAGDDTLEDSIISKLQNLIGAMLNMPEFHLI